MEELQRCTQKGEEIEHEAGVIEKQRISKVKKAPLHSTTESERIEMKSMV
jgi:hypothetical protein